MKYVNGNLRPVNGNLGPVNGNLGPFKNQQFAVIIGDLLYFAKTSKFIIVVEFEMFYWICNNSFSDWLCLISELFISFWQEKSKLNSIEYI